MKIIIIGPRGFPNVIGGIEKHCEELFPMLIKQNKNISIEVCAIKNNEYSQKLEWNGIRFKYFSTFQKSGFEKLFYALKATFYAVKQKPDIIHFQGINSTLFIPFLKLFNIKIVTTIHSRDYRYPKWGKFAKLLFKLSEIFSNLSDAIITVSELDYNEFKNKIKKFHLIRNGINITQNLDFNKEEYLLKYSLKEKNYLFTAARFTEEKDLETLINGYLKSGVNLTLVIAGDGITEYANKIKELIKPHNNIILTGFIYGDELKTLFLNARLFLLTSIFEVSPFSVLEAFSYNVDVLLSDINVNKVLPLSDKNFFEVKNIEDLSIKLKLLTERDIEKNELNQRIAYIKLNHDWSLIAIQTLDLYQNLILRQNKNMLKF